MHPCDDDQFGHAARLEVAGVATWLRRERDLGPAVDRLLADTGMLAVCRRFAARIAAEPGADRVRAMVRRHFAPGRGPTPVATP